MTTINVTMVTAMMNNNNKYTMKDEETSKHRCPFCQPHLDMTTNDKNKWQ